MEGRLKLFFHLYNSRTELFHILPAPLKPAYFYKEKDGNLVSIVNATDITA